MSISEIQSSNSNKKGDIDSFISEKEKKDFQFQQYCQNMAKVIFQERENLQSVMIHTSAIASISGTKTESVIFPSQSPRHQVMNQNSFSAESKE